MSDHSPQARTLADIARLAGVSTATASRALRDSPLVTEETKAHVRAIAREHNYQPHLVARNLRTKRTNTVAFVLPLDLRHSETLADPFLLQFVGAIGAALHEAGYDLLISHTESSDGTIGERYWRSGLADGLVVLGRTADDAHITALAEQGAPIVVWGPKLPGQRYSSIGPDNVTEARAAVRHLIEQGRRRIGMIGGSTMEMYPESYRRHQGYRQALEEAGLPHGPTLTVSGISTFASGREATQRLLAQEPEIDALFAFSDVMAIAAMGGIRESGRRIPDDVAVVGFDGIDLAAYSNPPLTTVSQRITDGGAEVLVDKLVAQIEGRGVDAQTFPGRLIVRESSKR